jgi:act minimal PKS chain-length factor (CLF/KS beta)
VTGLATTAIAAGTAVITGMGVLAPTGLDAAAFWAAALRGDLAIGPVRRFDAGDYPCRLAGELREFDPGRAVPRRLLPQTDIWTQIGLGAIGAALDDAALGAPDDAGYDLAVATGASAGGVEFGQREIESLWSKGPKHVGAYQSIAWFYAATTGQASIRHGFRGQCDTFVTEAAGGLDSLGAAATLLAECARAVICGGADSPLSPYGLVCQMAGGRLSPATDPATAYAPFQAHACGYVPGEGGAMFIVEDARGAAARGAPRVYGRIAGHAATFSPRPGSGRPPALRAAIEQALRRARAAPGDIDVVFADAAGVPELDEQEAAALAAVFGPRGVPVTAPKAGFGRLASGGSAVDVAAGLLSLRDQVIPPTPVTAAARPELELDLVTGGPRPARIATVLVIARGAGGFNSALVLRSAA